MAEAAAVAGGLLHLWNHGSIQILVLLSLGLQLVLFVFAGVRRRKDSGVRRLILWLAYIMADSTAIYALGHMSLSSAVHDDQLVAFWAPFFLLHLGGPDNISAYALEDNKLWKRHFLTLVVQIVGAAYVLYKNVGSSGNFLPISAILMFAVGAVKYLERTWALNRGNLDSIRSIVKNGGPMMWRLRPQDDVLEVLEGMEVLDTESHLRRAHRLFHICKRAIVDSSATDQDFSHSSIQESLRYVEYWTLVEMELSLLYDILYTKAAVIHTWSGYWIRVISPIIILESLLLFHFSGKDDGHSHRGTNVTITYVLFGGALLMETTCLLKAMVSSWTLSFLSITRCTWLRYKARGKWDRLRRAAVSVHSLVTAGGNMSQSRWWSGNMGQYNMLRFCTRPGKLTSTLVGMLAKIVRLEERWNSMHYSGMTINISDNKLMKEWVNEQMRLYIKLGLISSRRGRMMWGEEPLRRLGLYGGVFEQSFGDEFREGIIIWHIGTDVFTAVSQNAKAVCASSRVKVIKALSNYMMFLLVERPYMLPGHPQEWLYERTRDGLIKIKMQWTHRRHGDSISAMLMNLFHDGATDNEEFAKYIYADFHSRALSRDNGCVGYAAVLAEELLKIENGDTTDSLELVLEIWIDFLLYVAKQLQQEVPRGEAE